MNNRLISLTDIPHRQNEVGADRLSGIGEAGRLS